MTDMIRYFYSFIQKSIEYIYRYRGQGYQVFMFHQIDDDRRRWIDPNVCITKKGFLTFINGLQEKEYSFIAVDQLGKTKQTKKVLVTFDDIFSDAVEHAIPILNEKKIPFCVFISDIYVDQANFLSGKQLEALAQNPLCTIGYHTKTHRMMRILSRPDMEREISCQTLEKRIGKKIHYFAFPYGSLYACTRKSIRTIRRERYRYCFSTIAAPCTSFWMVHFKEFLPRINVNEWNYKKILEREK